MCKQLHQSGKSRGLGLRHSTPEEKGKRCSFMKMFKKVIFCLLVSSVDYVPHRRGEWGGDSEERGLEELL